MDATYRTGYDCQKETHYFRRKTPRGGVPAGTRTRNLLLRPNFYSNLSEPSVICGSRERGRKPVVVPKGMSAVY